MSELQSAYRKFHSSETALLYVQNDILASLDAGHTTALLLLDLSAAFDAVDHSFLTHRLQHRFGISSTALNLLSSFLSDRSHQNLILFYWNMASRKVACWNHYSILYI